MFFEPVRPLGPVAESWELGGIEGCIWRYLGRLSEDLGHLRITWDHMGSPRITCDHLGSPWIV